MSWRSELRGEAKIVPEVLQVARRTIGVVKLNIGFTALYNIVGLGLAALGLLPLIFAAAAQSLPDLGIVANSSSLLRQGKATRNTNRRGAAASAAWPEVRRALIDFVRDRELPPTMS